MNYYYYYYKFGSHAVQPNSAVRRGWWEMPEEKEPALAMAATLCCAIDGEARLIKVDGDHWGRRSVSARQLRRRGHLLKGFCSSREDWFVTS